MLNPLRDFGRLRSGNHRTGAGDIDEIIEIGAVRVRNGLIEDRMSCLLKADKALTPLVESLTGISKEILADARDAKECLEQFLRFAGGLPLVAHNSDFDSAFLEHALAKAGMPALPIPFSIPCCWLAWRGRPRKATAWRIWCKASASRPRRRNRALPDAEQSALLWIKAEEKLVRLLSRHPVRPGPRCSRPVPRNGAAFSAANPLVSSGEPPAASEPAGDLIRFREDGPEASGAAPAAGAAPATTVGTQGPASNASAESLFASGKCADAFAALGRPYQARARQARMLPLPSGPSRRSRSWWPNPSPARPHAGLPGARPDPGPRQRRPVFVSVAGRGRQDRIVTSEIPS